MGVFFTFKTLVLLLKFYKTTCGTAIISIFVALHLHIYPFADFCGEHIFTEKFIYSIFGAQAIAMSNVKMLLWHRLVGPETRLK